MSKTLVSVFVWALAFLAFELPAHFIKSWPWYTFSRTIWFGIQYWTPIALLVGAMMIVLTGHFEDHWSVKYLIGLAVGGAIIIVCHALKLW